MTESFLFLGLVLLAAIAAGMATHNPWVGAAVFFGFLAAKF